MPSFVAPHPGLSPVAHHGIPNHPFTVGQLWTVDLLKGNDQSLEEVSELPAGTSCIVCKLGLGETCWSVAADLEVVVFFKFQADLKVKYNQLNNG